MIIQKNYDEIYIKIKLNLDDDSPLKKTLKLHEYDRIDVSKGIDTNKADA